MSRLIYKGDTVSTIAEEINFNPRLKVQSEIDYANIMNNLNLSDPKQMDIAVPANLSIGLNSVKQEIKEATIKAEDVVSACMNDTLFVDLREESERARDGVIPGSVHLPYKALSENIKPGGLLSAIAESREKQILLYCAYGERSALGLQEMFNRGIKNIRHLGGGISAWIQAGGVAVKPCKPASQG